MIRIGSLVLAVMLLLPVAMVCAEEMRERQLEIEQTTRELAAKAAAEKKAAQALAAEKKEKIKADRLALEQAIAALKTEKAILTREVESLGREKRELFERETKLSKMLKKTSEMVKELVGVIRINAKDIDALSRDNLQTALQEKELSFMERIGNDTRFPGMDDVHAMSRYLFAASKHSGEVSRTQALIVDRAGLEREARVLVLGPFTAHYSLDGEQGFLNYSVEEQKFYALSRLPSKRMQRQIAGYLQAESESVPMDISRGAALRQLSYEKSLVEQVPRGGVLVWPIVALFIVGLLIILERVIFLLRKRVNGDLLLEELRQAVGCGDWQQAKDLCIEKGKKPVARILLVGLNNRDEKREEMENMLQEAILREIPPMERFLSTLGMLATIAPLLGLLGTVTGMIDTFHVITLHGTGDPRLMSGGISEALVTTMLGLSAAIPLMLAQNLLNRAVDRHIGTMEEKAVSLVNLIHTQRERTC